MLLIALLGSFLISLAVSTPLEPGQPGGPWTEDEIDIVRDKVQHRTFKSPGILNKCYYKSEVQALTYFLELMKYYKK